MLKRFLIIFFLVVLIIACQTTETPKLTDVERQEIADIIKQKSQEHLKLNASYNEENFNKWMGYMVETDDVSWMGNPGVFVHGIKVIQTLEDLDTDFRPALGTRSSTNFTVIKDYISVMSENHAVYVKEGKYSVTDLDGETSPEYSWTSTEVWLNKNGEWKMLHYHQSWSDTPIKTEEDER